MSSKPTGQDRHLSSLTPKRIRAAAKDEKSLVILCTGAIEQHGPHLPVGVDSILGEYFIQKVTERLKPSAPVWFAPPIWISKSDEHLEFPGTIWISDRSLRNQILSTVEQLATWGFKRMLILNTHGGNLPVIYTTLREANLEGAIESTLLESVPDIDIDEREKLYGIHAGLYETALLLSIAPELVRKERVDCQWMDDAFPAGSLAPENSTATFAWKTNDLTSSGTLGDARKATASDGEIWAKAAVDKIYSQIRELL